MDGKLLCELILTSIAEFYYRLEKMHDLKAENYVLFGGHTVDTLSDHSEGLLQRGKGGASIYKSFCNKNQVVGTSKYYC